MGWFDVLLLVMVGLFVIIEPQLTKAAVTFVVNTTADHDDGSCAQGVGGDCTLREAIIAANNTPGADEIRFNIGGGGAQTISPTSALPTITDPVVIDGTTQPGFAGTPLIELNGANAGIVNGLTITAGNSTVQGLVINRFGLSGISLQTNGGNQIVGNRIGTDAAGTADLGNGFHGIEILRSPNNVIGGVTTQARNVISGNDEDGVNIAEQQATGNRVEGNFIGTNAAGTAAIPNEDDGVDMDSANNIIIGGVTATPGAPPGNLISGNDDDGVEFDGGFDIPGAGNATGNVVQGNLIGTDVTGTAALPNLDDGVNFDGGANNTVGGATAGAGNVISGNDGEGVDMDGNATGNLIEGNLIGTDVTGSQDLGNVDDGIDIDSASMNNTIGGTMPGAGNVIAGNDDDGVDIADPTTTGNVIQGNFIGTNQNGANLGNSSVGVLFNATGSNTVGGTAAGAGNVISGNGSVGVLIAGGEGALGSNVVQGNFIGTNQNGANLGNLASGVEILSSNDNLIQGNTIAFNAAGTFDTGVNVLSGTGNAILSNSIFSNEGLGIDLRGGTEDANGVTENDAGDGDEEANNLQNFPVLTSATSGGGSTNIQGTLNSTADTTFRIEFFANTACDPSGFGEGQTFLGFTSVTTDGGGNAGINVALPTAVPAGQFITATATRLEVEMVPASRVLTAPATKRQGGGLSPVETSEFCQCVQVTSAAAPDLTGTWGNLTQTSEPIIFYGGRFDATNTLTGTFTVRNEGDVDAPSSIVRFFLSNDRTLNGGGAQESRVISRRNRQLLQSPLQQDLLLTEVATGDVTAEGTKRINLNLTLPHGVSAVNKFVIAVVDANNAVEESDEENNVMVSGKVAKAARVIQRPPAKPTKRTKRTR